MAMKVLGIIPARFESTRFPGKALVDILGKTMIQRVYEQSTQAKCLSKVIVATDHQMIFDHVKTFQGEVMMTSPSHPTGTDRCLEVLLAQTDEYDFAMNIQGDEPLIEPSQIDTLGAVLSPEVQIATLAKKIEKKKEVFNPNVVKVVVDHHGKALYFSRSTIPFCQKTPPEEWYEKHEFYKHLGIYAYRSDVLKQFASLESSELERTELLEQLRWLANGFEITVGLTQLETIGIDTPEDLSRLRELLSSSEESA